MPKPHLDHVGLIVRDMDNALDLFKNVFGVEPGEVREKQAMGLKLCILELANVNLELIQYTDDNSSFKPILGEAAGVNHLSLRVDNLDESTAKLESAGGNLAEGFPIQGSKGPLAFNHPESSLGILLELYQLSD